MNQFLYDLRLTAYGGWSPTYLADLHRRPKFVTEGDLQSSHAGAGRDSSYGRIG